MKTPKLVLALLFASPLVCLAAPPTKVSGGMLTGSNGMTLYTFDKDAAGSGKSVCNDGCADNLAAVLAMRATWRSATIRS